MPGRSTLTATSRPSVVRAKWTCAIEAAAAGTSSNDAYSVVERPRQLGLDQRLRLGSRKGRQAVLQGREIGGDLLAEKVGPS